MKKNITNYWILTFILAFFSLALTAQVPGTMPAGWQPGNPPSSAGLNSIYSVTGNYTISADGVGSESTSMTIRVDKPTASATVAKAILMSAVTNAAIGNGCCSLAGTSINWDGSYSYDAGFFNNYWADVTSIVAPVINPLGAGISTLDVTECNSGAQDGEALLVVFNDATAPTRTVIILFGGLITTGDNYAITLGTPIDPAAPGAFLDMGIGDGYSYQTNGSQQYSIINVNGQRLTTSAGGEDDGGPANGMLITVGGIGDSDANPPDPYATPTNPRSDDELYSLLPFITNTTTGINVNTINPSNDDNIFLSYFVISGAAILGEGILLTQTTSSGNVGDNHTVTALVQDQDANPIVGRQVTFTVTTGPNAGATGMSNTDGTGHATFTYPDSGGAGTDQIQACFTNDQSQIICSNTLAFTWVTQVVAQVPTLSQWGMILLGFILIVVSTVYIVKRRRIGISG